MNLIIRKCGNEKIKLCQSAKRCSSFRKNVWLVDFRIRFRVTRSVGTFEHTYNIHYAKTGGPTGHYANAFLFFYRPNIPNGII